MNKITTFSILLGIRKKSPLLPMAFVFGFIFGLLGATESVQIHIVSLMSIVIFAGAAQFIALVLLADNQPIVGIILAAVIVNLRHLIYGAALSTKLSFSEAKKWILGYFLTDEVFLVTDITSKERREEVENGNLVLDYVLLGAGLPLWIVFNLSTVIGHLSFGALESYYVIPENLLLSASFVGFLTDYWIKNPRDRPLILVLALAAIFVGGLVGSTMLLLMLIGTSSTLKVVWLGGRSN